MASRKLVRDLLLANRQLHASLVRLHAPQAAGSRSGLLTDGRLTGTRGLSVFKEFKKQVKGEASSNSEFQKSVKELNEKVGGIKEDLKARTKQTTEKLYKQVDGIWTEAESTARKVSANVKETISVTKAEVKESLGLGKEESSRSASAESNSTRSASAESNSTTANAAPETDTAHGFQSSKSNESGGYSDTVFSKLKSASGLIYPKVSEAFHKVKDTKVIDCVKKGYDVVKDELSGKATRKRVMKYASTSVSNVERSTRTEIIVVPSRKSHLGRKWEELKDKMRAHPMFKRVTGISEPVVTKSQELAEDMRERWETSDHPVVHKIQDLNETVFGETATALSFKEIRRRDPSFSLPEFVAEVQDMVRPTLNAYLKGDIETLKKYCSPEVIERCKGERISYESQGFFFDNKILHISEVDVRETKMMGSSPIIIVAFQTQQIYCVRDREGLITDGGKDTIQTVYYAWAMQLQEPEELGEDVLYPTWRLREMQQIGVQALI